MVRASDVSRNVSLLLESLLDEYDRQHRPKSLGGPTVVGVNMLIRSMGPISELDMVSIELVKSVAPLDLFIMLEFH